MMMRVHFFAIAAFCLIVLTGCGVLSAPAYQQTKQYDIALPEPVKERDYSVRIQALAGDSAGRFKMIYRNGTEIEQDEFNRWSLPPAAMITRYLRLAFADDGAVHTRKYVLSGAVQVFEADKVKKSCNLYFRYRITNAENGKELRSGMIVVKRPLNVSDEELPGAFSVAMAANATELVQKLNSIFRSL